MYLLQLLVLQVAPDHHLQHDEELTVADVAVAVDVVDAEGKAQLLLLVALAAEGAQARDKLLEVDVAAAVLVEDGNHAGRERVGGDLGQGEELIAVDGARVVLVELHEALAQTVHFIAVDCGDVLAEGAGTAWFSGACSIQLDPEAMLSRMADGWLPMVAGAYVGGGGACGCLGGLGLWTGSAHEVVNFDKLEGGGEDAPPCSWPGLALGGRGVDGGGGSGGAAAH